MSFADWLCNGQRLHRRLSWKWYLMCWTQTVHTWVSHMFTSPAPYTCDKMCYVHHVWLAARSSKNHWWLFGLEYNYSLREKWINCRHRDLTISAEQTKHVRPPENTPMGLTLGLHGRDINCIIHSFIHSFIECGLFLALKDEIKLCQNHPYIFKYFQSNSVLLSLALWPQPFSFISR